MQAFQFRSECVPVPQALQGDVLFRWQVRCGCRKELGVTAWARFAVLPECIGATPQPFLLGAHCDPEPWSFLPVIVFVVIGLYPGSLRLHPIMLRGPATVQVFWVLCLRDQCVMIALRQHPDHEVASCSWHVGYGASAGHTVIIAVRNPQPRSGNSELGALSFKREVLKKL